MIEATTVLRTAGDGYWSETAKDVDVTGFYVGYINEEADFGELCVYFNTDKWNVDNDGLIYTDSLFMQQLREWLTTLGLDASDVGYSEQGMQGDDYVSCDVGDAFITSYKAKYADEFAEAYADCN